MKFFVRIKIVLYNVIKIHLTILYFLTPSLILFYYIQRIFIHVSAFKEAGDDSCDTGSVTVARLKIILSYGRCFIFIALHLKQLA